MQQHARVTGRKTDLGALLLEVLSDEGAVVAGATSDHTAVARADLMEHSCVIHNRETTSARRMPMDE